SAAWLLMLHGGGAMATLMLLGALLPLHAYRAWRSKRNRTSGMVIAALNFLLIATSFGLYYASSEAVRPGMSNVHIAVVRCLPFVLVLHIVLGRRASER